MSARAVFHPTWIPPSLDPSVDTLKKARVIAGAVAAFGVYTFVEGGFAFDGLMNNAVDRLCRPAVHHAAHGRW